jgi:hypothetical protein
METPAVVRVWFRYNGRTYSGVTTATKGLMAELAKDPQFLGITRDEVDPRPSNKSASYRQAVKEWRQIIVVTGAAFGGMAWALSHQAGIGVGVFLVVCMILLAIGGLCMAAQDESSDGEIDEYNAAE